MNILSLVTPFSLKKKPKNSLKKKYILSFEKQLIYPFFKKPIILSAIRNGLLLNKNAFKRTTTRLRLKNAEYALRKELSYLKKKPLAFALFKKRKQKKTLRKEIRRLFFNAGKRLDMSRKVVSTLKKKKLKKVNVRFFLSFYKKRSNAKSLLFSFKKDAPKKKYHFNIKRKVKKAFFVLGKLKGLHKVK